MKTKKGFNLREVCGEKIIVAEGKENIDFSNIISMNETAAFLWDSVKYREFTAQDLVDILQAEYDVDNETAKADVDELLLSWAKSGIIEGDDMPEVEETIMPQAEKTATEPQTEGKKPKGLFGRLFKK